MKIAEGGISWIITFFIVTILSITISYFLSGISRYIMIIISALMLMISFLLLIFFRDPIRKTGSGIVAVADGFIREITYENDKDLGNCVKISTFMNIHNVHVNRMPITGEISKITHHNGSHLPAFKKESERNERVEILVKTDIGIIKIIQIAGTIARRIVPYIKIGDTVKKGEKIGIIRLGSRVDIYLPKKKIKKLTIKLKDKIKAGEDTIAKIND